MNFISPSNFAFAGLIGFIVLLYVLRLKRKEKVVASTLLWESALRDLQANAPWQKLRSSLLMWLQIAFLAIAAFALARPSIKVFSTGGQTVAIILDSSASMKATDISPSRFEKARSEALRLVNNLSAGDGAMLIGASQQTKLLSPLTTDKKTLQRAISGAVAEDTVCNLREAVLLASSLLRNKRNAQIYVLSDGAVAPLDDLSLDKIGMQFVRIGSGNNNVAITAMDVRRDYAEGTPYQIFATVHNYSNQSKTVNLELSHNGELVVVRPLTIPAGGQQSQLFESKFTQGLFSVGFQEKDDLATDNIAYAAIEAPQAIKVLLISSGNLFLEKALNVDPQVQLFRTTASEYATTRPQGPYDVVVCDSEAPTSLPATSQLLFNASTSLAPITVGKGFAASPSVVDWDRRHPVTRFAPWNDIRFSQSQFVTVKPWGKELVEAERTPLVVAGEQGGKRVIWCGFDLGNTDLPLRVTFPIFINNALHWLAAPRGSATASQSTPRRAGETIALDIPAGTKQVAISAPDKSTRRVPTASSPLLYDSTRQVGVYTAAAGDWKRTFAVNLLNAGESDLKPKDSLKVQDGEAIGGESRARANRELWSYVVLVGLLLLGVEWWVFHRGV